jgi:anti-sigma factor RsiW
MTYRHTLHLHGNYLDGELSQEQRTQVEKHLDNCRECREDLEKLRVLISTLGRIEPPDPGNGYFDGLYETTMARTVSVTEPEPNSENALESRNQGRRVLITLIRLAATVTLLFAAFYISDFNREQKATRWTKHIAEKGGLVATDENGIEDHLMQPIGNIMVPGPPTLGDREKEPQPDGMNLE